MDNMRQDGYINGYASSDLSDVVDSWTDGSALQSDMESTTGYLENTDHSASDSEHDLSFPPPSNFPTMSFGINSLDAPASISGQTPIQYVSDAGNSSVNSAPLKMPQLRICESCQGAEVSWHCSVCGQICKTCSTNHLPAWVRSHKIVPIQEYQHSAQAREDADAKTNARDQRQMEVFRNILSADDDAPLSTLHSRETNSLWFAVAKATPKVKEKSEEQSPLELDEYYRLNQVVEEHCRIHNLTSSDCYPRVVSFVGNTGAGKSSLIRLLIERAWTGQAPKDRPAVPVIGNTKSYKPTTGNVHLYRDHISDSEEVSKPLLFADCEGFHGQNQYVHDEEPSGEPLSDAARQPGMVERSYRYMRRKLSNFIRRDDVVQTIFPRLLYNFSDVVVFVMQSGAERETRRVLEMVLAWADSSHSSAVNRFTLPHVIIVLNRCDNIWNCPWNPDWTTETILKEHADLRSWEGTDAAKAAAKFRSLGVTIDNVKDLLLQSYSSIRFIRLPNLLDPPQLARQLHTLRGMIDTGSLNAQRQRTQIGMRLNTSSLHHFCHLALNHYSAGNGKPFDYIGALFTTQPLPDTIASRFLHLMKVTLTAMENSEREWTSSELAEEFASILAPVVCTSIAVDTSRSYCAQAWSLLGNYNEGGDDDVKGDESARATAKSYDDHVKQALKELCDKSVKCSFKHSGGARCVNIRRAHSPLDRHQDKLGQVIGTGKFMPELSEKILAHWQSAMDGLGMTLRHGSSDRASIWALHEDNLKRLFGSVSNVPLHQRPICYWCIRNSAAETLPCGHGICDACITAKGSTNAQDSRAIDIASCNLHETESVFQPPASFLVLPKSIGRRILTIDGGGVRGLLSLKILADIEHRLGGKLSLSAFFDLIGGTGSGGLLSLILGLNNCTIKELEVAFRKVYSDRAFAWRLFFARAMSRETHYETGFDEIIKDVFGQLAESRLLFSTNNELHGERPRVFVPVCRSSSSDTPAILANYPRHFDKDKFSSSSRAGGVRAAHEAESFRVWEAVKATVAIPGKFPPLEKTNDGDTSYYYDGGGVLSEHPSITAVHEADRIWPTTRGKVHDILLSIGNGVPLEKLTAGFGYDKSYETLPRSLNSEKGSLPSLSYAYASPRKYFRFNPDVGGMLPQLDDFDALTTGGRLEKAVTEYLSNGFTKASLNDAVLTLLASSLYFHPIETVDETTSVVLKGSVKCRFMNGSATSKNLAEAIRQLQEPRIEYSTNESQWTHLDGALRSMQDDGILELPIISLKVPATRSLSREVAIRLGAVGIEPKHISGSPSAIGDFL